MPGNWDRMSISWSGDRELAEAKRVRELAALKELSVNKLLKTLLRQWLKEQEDKKE